MKKIVYRVICAISLIILLILIICAYNQKYTRVQAQSIENTEIYIVQPGDTLWNISKKYVQGDPREFIYDLKKINGIGTVIYPGQEIKIPKISRR